MEQVRNELQKQSPVLLLSLLTSAHIRVLMRCLRGVVKTGSGGRWGGGADGLMDALLMGRFQQLEQEREQTLTGDDGSE